MVVQMGWYFITHINLYVLEWWRKPEHPMRTKYSQQGSSTTCRFCMSEIQTYSLRDTYIVTLLSLRLHTENVVRIISNEKNNPKVFSIDIKMFV